MALFYGAAILSESVSATDIAGLLLILAGVTLGAGKIRLRRAAVAG